MENWNIVRITYMQLGADRQPSVYFDVQNYEFIPKLATYCLDWNDFQKDKIYQWFRCIASKNTDAAFELISWCFSPRRTKEEKDFFYKRFRNKKVYLDE